MNIEKLFCSIDTHVGGEAFRIVIQSSIALIGNDVQSNQKDLADNFENEKKLLLNEPRGHRGMNGCIIAPSKAADFQLLFFNHECTNDFKYEALFAATTALIETGNLKRTANDSYNVETMNGIYTVHANVENQEVISVYLEGISCSVIASSQDSIEVSLDASRKYLIYPLPNTISGIELDQLAAISNWGIAKTSELIQENIDFNGVILVEEFSGKVRSVTFEKDGYILRSPGIDSTCAIHTSINLTESKYEIENESIFGSSLTTKLQYENESIFSIKAVPFVTGSHEFIFDTEDPLKEGFILA
ncbi:proline racemase family protein [Psychrobacillus sp. FSL H8-0484]|uniref:proline racemase family protein n=1 Tax=Psychrobacillus sp. FSL H8-0484 TaxID=2921390 RepID=UPI0030F5234F